MLEIREVVDFQLKMDISDNVLRALPEWFGNESALVEYVNMSAVLPFWAAYDDDEAVGFLALKPHNALHAELCVMGVMKCYHRSSIGRELFNAFQNYCIHNNYHYISVKTLDHSCDYEPYNKTRAFYEAMGFQPFEVHKTLWDENNPCLIMIKNLK